ncbi:right-handed parallel beta-helix repeat-containing protein [Paenibacillus methanolicus]|nr:right-handed parallel beta-helix repeat-containing protein [Paenibacillus methanolicus]
MGEAGRETMLSLFVCGKHGDDGNEGSRDRPFATIRRAQAAVQEAIRGGDADAITVDLRGGIYPLAEPLRFGPDDADVARCPVVYRNAEGETPILTGGRLLGGWERWRGNVWRTRVEPGTRFQTLYADGIRVAKARWPAAGYLLSAASLDGEEREGIGYLEGDFPVPADTSALQAHVWPGEGEWNWFTETIPVAEVDADRRRIVFERPCTWGIGAHSRYYLQGALEFLREPGQFHLEEREEWLYYIPAAGVQSPAEQTIIAPSMMRLIEIAGESEDRMASGLTFQGFRLAGTDAHADHIMMRSEPGMDNCEPEANRSGVIYARYASDVRIDRCTISQSGTCGIFLDRSAERFSIVGNVVERFGHSGIYACGYAPGEGDFATAELAHRNRGHVIADNRIRHGGELIGHGSGIVLFQSGDNEIAHNRIERMPRYGISLKGLRFGAMPDRLRGEAVTWDNHWDFLFTRNNLIYGNDISEVMTDSQDGGMIESWGIGRGNRICGNRLHHSGIHFSFGFGIYLDDASDDVEVTGNLLDHLYSDGDGKLWMAIFAKGIGNRIANNLIVDNPDAACAIGSQEMAGEANRELAIERNIVANSGHLYCCVNWTPERLRVCDRNLYWREGEPSRVTGKLPAEPLGDNPVWGREYAWETWRSMLGGAYDAATINADPRFADPTAGDYRLLPDSPAYRLGWKDIDLTSFGPRVR